mmetsp:Transcript_2242/g.4871  ORF Transcript_2242/g.4871 Transcript_2242/m.4871 type:complete len:271 (+) Transcript_2242:1927-2739(+)
MAEYEVRNLVPQHQRKLVLRLDERLEERRRNEDPAGEDLRDERVRDGRGNEDEPPRTLHVTLRLHPELDVVQLPQYLVQQILVLDNLRRQPLRRLPYRFIQPPLDVGLGRLDDLLPNPGGVVQHHHPVVHLVVVAKTTVRTKFRQHVPPSPLPRDEDVVHVLSHASHRGQGRLHELRFHVLRLPRVIHDALLVAESVDAQDEGRDAEVVGHSGDEFPFPPSRHRRLGGGFLRDGGREWEDRRRSYRPAQRPPWQTAERRPVTNYAQLGAQ